MTGAGISTSSGIPDYRSQTGIFASQAKEYGFEGKPEEMFSIQTFKSKPEVFYSFIKNFDHEKYEPTLSHVRIHI